MSEPNEDLCGKCRKAVRQRDRALECEACETWYHIGCDKVSVPQYEFFCDKDNKHIPYCCKRCAPNVKQSVRKINSLKEENQGLKDKILKLEDTCSQGVA